MEKAKMVDYFLERIERNEIEIDGVRKEMEKNNVPEEEIKSVVRLIDSEIRSRLSAQVSEGKAKQLMTLGIVLASIGLLLTIGTYVGILPSGNSFFIVYGPMLAGIGIYYKGVSMKSKTPLFKKYFNKKPK